MSGISESVYQLMSPSSDLPSPCVLLASRSPRRRQMLTDAGISHVAEGPGFEDGVLLPPDHGKTSPEQWVMSLAYLKAWTKASEASMRRRAGEPLPGIVIGADTACVDGDRLIGTPTSAAEAEAMIRGFVGKSHRVVTGVALVEVPHAEFGSRPHRRMFADVATVALGTLSDEQIDEYVRSGGWEGKAGGYNLSERKQAGWPLTHEGDATTIMGLPMERLKLELPAFAAAVGGDPERGGVLNRAG